MPVSRDPVAAGQDLRVAVGRVARRIRQLYADSSAKAELSFTEAAVLVRLERDGPTSPGAIAGREKVTSQAIAAVLSNLRRRGLVSRSPHDTDRRRAVVAITERGRSLLKDNENAVVEALVRALTGSFTDAERRRLDAVVPLLNRLAEVI